jgi:Fe/S biogenesis protein NfuA
MVTITERAKGKFLEVTEAEGRSGHGLRVIVSNGGTAAPEFALNFVEPDQANDDDVIVDVGEFKIFVDPESVKFLEEASIDFIDELGQSGFKVEAPHAGIPKPEGPLADSVQRILEEKVNPAIASHGGFVELVAIEEGTAYLKFGGGCQGCGMIQVTLKEGVEKILLEEVPEITKVMDITDHASGANPYYQPAK